jgi:XTP/dITP diphosphohydrolase
MERIVRDKVTRAFREIGRPLFVEQTGLYLAQLNGLPGGLTQEFWDALHADRFSTLFGQDGNNSVVAKTMLGYTDGRQIYVFGGEVSGIVSSEPRGSKDFQWDCVFQPDGFDKTFAELGDLKNEISMRRKALDKFSHFLKDHQ